MAQAHLCPSAAPPSAPQAAAYVTLQVPVDAAGLLLPGWTVDHFQAAVSAAISAPAPALLPAVKCAAKAQTAAKCGHATGAALVQATAAPTAGAKALAASAPPAGEGEQRFEGGAARLLQPCLLPASAEEQYASGVVAAAAAISLTAFAAATALAVAARVTTCGEPAAESYWGGQPRNCADEEGERQCFVAAPADAAAKSVSAHSSSTSGAQAEQWHQVGARGAQWQFIRGSDRFDRGLCAATEDSSRQTGTPACSSTALRKSGTKGGKQRFGRASSSRPSSSSSMHSMRGGGSVCWWRVLAPLVPTPSSVPRDSGRPLLGGGAGSLGLCCSLPLCGERQCFAGGARAAAAAAAAAA